MRPLQRRLGIETPRRFDIHAWFQLIRLPAGFSAVSNIAAAHCIATLGIIQWSTLCLSVLTSLCLYYGGMALNDCVDYAEDRCDRPTRPLVTGRLSVAVGWCTAFCLIFAGLCSAAFVSGVALTLSLALATAIVLYNSKMLSGLGAALLMATCRYLNWGLGLCVLPLTDTSLLLGLPIFCYVSAVTLLSQDESQARDRKALFACAIMLAVTGFAMVLLATKGVFAYFSTAVVLLLAIGYYGTLLMKAARNYTPQTLQESVGKMIMTIVFLDAAMVLMAGQALAALCILLLMLPPRYIAKHLYVS